MKPATAICPTCNIFIDPAKHRCVSTKVCRVCKRELSIGKFRVNAASADGHRHTCVDCEAEAENARRQPARPYRDERKPSQVTDDFFVYWENTEMPYPPRRDDSGKWLVFQRKGEKLDTLWELVKQALESGKLGRRAKVSTMKSNPHARNPSEGVICIYTYSIGDIEDVRRVRESLRLHCGVTWKISYKLDSDTGQKYSVQGDTGISKLYE